MTGTIGAGKSTLASRLAQEYGAVLISSDAIREGLSLKAQRSGKRVFSVMAEQLEAALAQGASIVLDSSGMSPRFRSILRAQGSDFIHVHLQLDDPRVFEEREQQRADRRALPRAAFNRSRSTEFTRAPDLVIATDALHPDQVYAVATDYIAARTIKKSCPD